MVMTVGGSLLITHKYSSAHLGRMHEYLTSQVQNNIRHVIDQMLEGVRRPAYLLQALDPVLRQCSLPTSQDPFDPSTMIRIMDSYRSFTDPLIEYPLGSVGVAISGPMDGKQEDLYRWELVVDPDDSCYEYTYRFQDASTDGRMYGLCAWSNLSISSDDFYLENRSLTPLSPIEALLLNGSKGETFLPLPAYQQNPDQDLENGLTYLLPVRCDGFPEGVYALTSARKSLSQLEEHLLFMNMNMENGVAYVVESQTSFLVASSAENQTLYNDQGYRVNVSQALDLAIASTSRKLLAHANQSGLQGWEHFSRLEMLETKDWVITAQRYYNRIGIDWVVVVAYPSWSVYQDQFIAYRDAMIAAGILMILALIMTSCVLHGLITRPLREDFQIRRKRRPSTDHVQLQDEMVGVVAEPKPPLLRELREGAEQAALYNSLEMRSLDPVVSETEM